MLHGWDIWKGRDQLLLAHDEEFKDSGEVYVQSRHGREADKDG